MKHADLIIIGAGPGGYETAVRAARAGLDTVLVEADKVGGTCLNEGCIPTKCLCRNASFLNDLKEAGTYGVDDLSFSFDIRKAVVRKNQVVSTLSAGIETLLSHPSISRVCGKAEFSGDAHTVYVPDARNPEGSLIEETYTAPHVIIATGSVTKMLPIPGVGFPGVFTSTEMLDLDRVPQRLCIVGGGVIGLEFASIFNAFGSQVTVVEFCKEVLPNFDSDIAKRLRLALKSKGITFVTQAAVQAIRQGASAEEYEVEYECKGKSFAVGCDVVLMAVGRVANLSSLNLVEVGIQTDGRGIVTDESFRTNVSGVFAIGDVNGRCQLAHAASFQGLRVLNTILGKDDQIQMDVIPAAVFTMPEASMVGKTEQQCQDEQISVQVHKAFFRTNGKALTMNEPEGMVKLLTEPEGRIIGCHIYGPHAADLIQEVATLMNKKGTLVDLANIIHAHPTLGEVVMDAAHA